MIEYQMLHLNYNMLCGLMIKTSGPNPLKHDIVQICVVPVDHFLRISEKATPFTMDIVPRRINEIDYKTCEISRKKLAQVVKEGNDSMEAVDRFEDWFNHLELKGRKRIVPICYNWSKIKPFMLNWLGHETCSQLIADQVRDLLTLAVAANDKATMTGRPYPFAKPIFPYLCKNMGVTRYGNGCDVECVALIETYRRMIINQPLVAY